ncbi:hypothetical protein SEA_OHMYWARD_11 [Gordonia phage OhMyWard]|uniref:Uncharacterized protein n=1 Tax=Gordonia phage OhMyWard TaxID=2652414 RepID=A0A5P8D788_9CAUD|nr:hypothetical protein HWC72_gp11 [Gordonia phage OhMyWard]QFP94893.1 hypothetical protein SEA_OHMYWARD_11 [Gordonia phage OhMyWard]WNM72387.1 hypothetical protein SEA_MOSSY_8 [Gordonia phage Mossy]
MATRRKSAEPKDTKRRRPATTPESRENQLIAAAVDLAEKQIAEGTVSSQVLTHYLKLGSSREKLEQERLRNENAVLRAKAEAMASAKKVEELYGQALNAMRSYAGHEPVSLGDPLDDD